MRQAGRTMSSCGFGLQPNIAAVNQSCLFLSEPRQICARFRDWPTETGRRAARCNFMELFPAAKWWRVAFVAAIGSFLLTRALI